MFIELHPSVWACEFLLFCQTQSSLGSSTEKSEVCTGSLMTVIKTRRKMCCRIKVSQYQRQGWGLWVTSLQQPPVRTDKLLFTVEKLLLFFSFVMQPGAFSSWKLKSILQEICVWCTCRALVALTPGVPLFTEWMFTLTEHCHVHWPLDGLLWPSSAVCHSCLFVGVYFTTKRLVTTVRGLSLDS